MSYYSPYQRDMDSIARKRKNRSSAKSHPIWLSLILIPLIGSAFATDPVMGIAMLVTTVLLALTTKP